jgi:protein-L-isoaspartate(D-aspartate) O-methyltransferase
LKNYAPFDGIIVTAAASHIPENLLAQLAEGGRMVIPVGSDTQTLYLIERHNDEFKKTELETVKFVPLLGGLA